MPDLAYLRPGEDAPELMVKVGDRELVIQLTWNQLRRLNAETGMYMDGLWVRLFKTRDDLT